MKSSTVKTRSKVAPVPEPADPVEYLTPAEVAAKYRMELTSLANMRNRGYGPEYIKFNTRVLYPKHKLEEYLKSRTFGGKKAIK